MKHFCILQTTKNYIIKISFLIILKLFSFLINKNYSIKSWILGVNNDFSSNDRENHQLKIIATTQKSIYDLQEETHSDRYKSKKSKIKNKILRIYLSDKFFFFFSRIMKAARFSTQRCTHAKAIFLREKEYYLFVVPDKVP